ncbi:hypothetical protein JMJ77_0014879, partial [Colletotrichum scovillei]
MTNVGNETYRLDTSRIRF